MAENVPGNPNVAGALILDDVALLHGQQRSTRRIRRVAQAELLGVLRPQEICDVDFKGSHEGICKFECRRGERLVASGLPEIGQ